MKRVWIYQADRILTDQEKSEIQISLDEFAKSWKVHGSPLQANASVVDNLFIVLAVDEDYASASGCSIDSSVRFLKGIEQKYNLSLFDRMQVAYKLNNELQVASRPVFEELVKTGVITDDTIVYDNTLTSEDELSAKWAIPFKDSWHKRVFG